MLMIWECWNGLAGHRGTKPSGFNFRIRLADSYRARTSLLTLRGTAPKTRLGGTSLLRAWPAIVNEPKPIFCGPTIPLKPPRKIRVVDEIGLRRCSPHAD